jgi:hypothetical protein
MTTRKAKTEARAEATTEAKPLRDDSQKSKSKSKNNDPRDEGRCLVCAALVLGEGFVDAVGPGQDAAGEVADVGVALFLEEESGTLGTGT